MRTAVAFLALLCAAFPASAKAQRRSFQVGAVVVRGARIGVGPSRLELAGKSAVLVTVGAASPRLVTGGIALPPGPFTVTIHY